MTSTAVMENDPPVQADDSLPLDPLIPGQYRRAFIDTFFEFMMEKGASDLHLSPDCTPMLRIDGSMRPFPDYPVLSPAETAGILYEVMPERNQHQFVETHDTDFAYEIPDLARFRCNVFMDRKGMGGVFRVIPTKILSCDQLGIPEAVKNLCFLTKGLVLVTGPTGSGKSTTLAAMMDLVNATREDHIITIEDPIEFVHPNKKCLVNQREIGVHSQSFKAALKAALREDPDIVLVGEMRDLETIAIAIETAETGHLVFGTLHTTTAASTVDRIIDQFPTAQQNQVRMMLSESLKGVISQTLMKKQGGGRVAALEILLGASSVSNLIREGKTFQIPSVMQTSSNLGMQTLNDSILYFVKKRMVDPLEAYMKAVDKAGMMAMLEENGIRLDLSKIAENAKKKTEDEELWA